MDIEKLKQEIRDYNADHGMPPMTNEELGQAAVHLHHIRTSQLNDIGAAKRMAFMAQPPLMYGQREAAGLAYYRSRAYVMKEHGIAVTVTTECEEIEPPPPDGQIRALASLDELIAQRKPDHEYGFTRCEPKLFDLPPFN